MSASKKYEIICEECLSVLLILFSTEDGLILWSESFFFASVYLFFLKQIRDCPLHYAVKGTLKKYEEMVVM